MVPTTQTVKYCFLLDQLVLRGHNTLMIGSSGVGKTYIVQNFLNNLNSEKYAGQLINFSA